MKYYLLPLLLFLTFNSFGFSQAKSSTKAYYKLFDSYVYHKNYEVFNGQEYVDAYPELKATIKTNNKFYGSFNFQKGTIIYDKQPYYDLDMKYDLLNDCVLLKYLVKKANYLKLNSEMITEFKLKEDKFVKLNNNSVLHAFYKNGFFKEAYHGESFSLYIKHKKNKQEDLDPGKGGVIYVFEAYNIFVVSHKDTFYRIDSKRDLLKAFPSREKDIRTFYKNNARLLRHNKEAFFVKLVTYLDTSNDTNTNE